jgi:hypothetical protein
MKKALLSTFSVLGIAATLGFQSCDKIKEAIPSQDVSFDGASADIIIPPVSDTTAQGSIAETSFKYNLDSLIKAQTSGALGFSNIQSIKVNSISITLNDADQANNFANFSYAGLSFNTDASNYDVYNLGYIANNPDAYSATLTPPVLDANQDLKKYFGANTTLRYLFVAKLRRKTTKALHGRAQVKYTITVKA